ncbi:hypothetical protein CROQUDRAFT_132599 [Cronartium quercuum f. sp. fusiforme G11]|uniref:RNA-dependent RNA polymerase n=1 Tax=Cronartium quercuum f. sp. fusiforme G11 TaxID=708437 RepID=A0A9P6NI00_9BASI|nr:hypothetical protein CROQUDRAFT_132599 [Cronartium quercuum f. sp. fusiforme G11]
MNEFPDAFGVQWELTRMRLENLTTDRIEASSYGSEVGKTNAQNHLNQLDLSPNRRALTNFSSSAVSLEVWQELDLEFQSDVEGKGRSLGFLNPSLSLVDRHEEGTSDYQSFLEFPPDWYGGKVKFSGKIEIMDKGKRTFKVHLKAPIMDRSSFFKRKFGSHSFLQLELSRDVNPRAVSWPQAVEFAKRPIRLLGRIWRAYDYDNGIFYYVSTSRPDGSSSPQDLNSFGHPPKRFHRTEHVELQDLFSFTQWYCPLEENRDQIFNKVASRFKLGRSPTIPGILFDTFNIDRGQDRKGVDDVILDKALDTPASDSCATDGNGWMNKAAFELLRIMLHENEPRTIVQARICGSKGTWILGPENWSENSKEEPKIMIRKSQIKIRYGEILDINNRILHIVIKRNQPSGILTRTLMEIMVNQGIEYKHFERLFQSTLQATYERLGSWKCENGEDENDLKLRLLEAYMKRTLKNNPQVDEDELISNETTDSSYPISKCLSAGFLPLTCPYLAKKMISEINKRLMIQMKRVQIPCPQSVRATIVPDCEGVLKENQIALSFSTPMLNKDGSSIDALQGEVLIMRHPCMLPTDIRKVTAVRHPVLSKYKDMVILPIKGKRSLASILNGGDLDGDSVLVIWNQDFTKNFRNAKLKHSRSPFKNEKLFHDYSTRLSEFMKTTKVLNLEEKIKLLQEKIFEPILIKSPHKQYCSWHIKSCFSQGPAHPESIRLAHISMQLIDAPKNGQKIKLKYLRSDRSKWDNYAMPEYHRWMNQDGNNEKLERPVKCLPLKRDQQLGKYPVDQLRTFAQKLLQTWMKNLQLKQKKMENESTLVTLISTDKPIQKKYNQHLDQDLLAPWLECVARRDTPSWQKDCEKIEEHVKLLYEHYKTLTKSLKASDESQNYHEKNNPTGSVKKKGLSDPSSSAPSPLKPINSTIDKYNTITKLTIEFHQGLTIDDMSSDQLLIKAQEAIDHLEALKASCAYFICTSNSSDLIGNTNSNELGQNFVWEVALESLCKIKRKAKGKINLNLTSSPQLIENKQQTDHVPNL